MKHKTILSTVLVTALLIAVTVTAEIPRVINYQGNLTASDGTPLDGSYQIRFIIYDAATGGTEKWNSGFQTVNVADGLFEVKLGESPMPILPDNLFSTDTTRYLGITVGADVELTPRTKFTTVAFAYKALRADSADIALSVAANTVGPPAIIDGSITSTDIDNSSVQERVTGTASSGYYITAINADGSVVTDADQVGTGDITAVYSGSGLAGGGDEGDVTLSILTGGVTSTHIQNNTIQFDDIGQNGASINQIMKWNGSAWIPRDDSAGIGPNWSVTDSVLYTNNFLGIARGGAGNALLGSNVYTMVNLGVACTTGTYAYATIGGGFDNDVTSYSSTVSGGRRNHAGVGGATDYCTVAGGHNNTAIGDRSVVSGGYLNVASGDNSTVSGGNYNIASGEESTVGGGYSNEASGQQSTIGGGNNNTASGLCSFVAGGCNNSVLADYTFAGGNGAVAKHDGSFVWADASGSELNSTAPNQFLIRAAGGTIIYSNSELTAGVTIHPGASAWAINSDRNLKENFFPVNGKELLEKITMLPISEWNYKSQDQTVRHIGPVAQDFRAIFSLGDDDVTISTIDPAGVALAGIKELIIENQELKKTIEQMKRDIEKLKNR